MEERRSNYDGWGLGRDPRKRETTNKPYEYTTPQAMSGLILSRVAKYFLATPTQEFVSIRTYLQSLSFEELEGLNNRFISSQAFAGYLVKKIKEQ